MRCSICGAENRAQARCCAVCGQPLPGRQPLPAGEGLLSEMLTQAIAPPESLYAGEEETMETNLPLFANRFAPVYPLTEPWPVGPLEVRDLAPWQRCWACGSTANDANESYCIDCGAALEARVYPAFLSQRDAPSGPALIDRLADPLARAILPDIVEQCDLNGMQLTVLAETELAPLTPPLDETTALTIGASLAQLLVNLHGSGIALGSLTIDDLGLSGPAKVCLRQANQLRLVNDAERDATFQADLLALAEVLERLTAIPRTTQRLSEETAADADQMPDGLGVVLRQIRTGELHDAAAVAARLSALRDERTHPVPLFQLAGSYTDVGRVRDHNEDSLFKLTLCIENNGQRQSCGVYIVADGMGGHAAGEVASGMAIRAAARVIIDNYLQQMIAGARLYHEAEMRELVRQAVLAANEAIHRESRAQANDMGSTLTMALVVGDRAVIANVGDSRTYLFRDGKLRRISKDHSLVMRLVELGHLREEDIYTHPQRNAVLRSLGDRAEPDVDLFSLRLLPGDALLLCSDGQWEMTRDPEMERILTEEPDPQRASAALVAAANRAGGEDNIAVILVRMTL
ncbi:protein phosphatase [Chloroflexus islandicus]|uniref:Protein phosphatase n=1 Tax=Chloroflexus islandicus TaxID=1707952 RepID=A0A178MAW4_9CHLR|nr:protein phosphatase 2C domain-containing protein [Chloroflexus islandicus]OAN45185.1 protein phosphatase [Chloroflexus islandicus]